MRAVRFESPARRLVYVVVLCLIGLALVGVALLAVPGSPWRDEPRLGLDLQGGVEVVLRALPPPGESLTREEVDRSLHVMQNRIDRLGVAEHDARRQGSDEIVVQLAGVRDPAAAARAIGEPARLEVYDLEPNLLAGPASTRAALLRGKPRPPGTVFLTCAGERICPDRAGGVSRLTRRAWYLVRSGPALTGPDFAQSVQDFDPEAPVVPVHLTPAGARKFHRLTSREAARGRARGAVQHALVVLDREIETVIGLDYTLYPSGIRDAGFEVRRAELKDLARLALVLQTGSLPVRFQQLERVEVSATLGRDALRQARLAALLGLVAVAGVLLVLYRFLGLVAVLGLVVYAAFLYALIVRLDVTLTLPGFAGVILTIGLAADANVVVFERIRDELLSGKPLRAAVAAGYSKGFRTVVDAHVVTAITAVVLFAVATAAVRGFALLLLFGTVVSLVTAVAATRALLGVAAGFAWFERSVALPRRPARGGTRLELDFVGRRRPWFALSAALLATGAFSLAVRGLDLGIDFRGGSQLTFRTPSPHSTGEVRSAAGRADAVVQGLGGGAHGRYTSWQIRTRPLTPAAKAALQHALEARLGARALGITVVSGSFARRLAWLTVWGILGSLALTTLYVRWRFDLRFALAVLAALVHDVALTVGVYSLSGREVTTATVAAVLTVLGYSLYDTIIVFDRIRENVRVLVRPTFTKLANISLAQTIRRSLTTTGVTLLPVASLLAFGGATLRDFAFAILVGVLAGAYSSFFIATPLLVLVKEREQRFVRRRAAAAPS